jgi:sensor histidine kinase YesM
MGNALSRKKIWVTAAHVASWVILFSLPALLRPDFSTYDDPKYKEELQLLKSIMQVMKIWLIGFFYLNAQVLIPKFIYKQQYGRFVLSIAGVLLLLLAIDWTIVKTVVPDIPYRLRNFLFFNIFPLTFMLVASSTYRLVIDRIKSDQREKDRVNEQLKTELSLLRSQVSPHFMFNVLNNMVAMARKKSDLLEDSLIKLSHLLRYMLYETAHTVTVNKELEYLGDYIDLQRLRFGNTVDIRFTQEINDPNGQIQPMLLIPFVENAFKHGVVAVADPQIIIDIREQHGTIELNVINTYNPNPEEVKDATHGIGLENVVRRLELLYPGSHQLTVKQDDHRYHIKLSIRLR